MDEFEAQEKVEKCKTLLDLANVIREIGGSSREINGLTRSFDAEKMAQFCENLTSYPLNVLTSNYGIRYKALEILGEL